MGRLRVLAIAEAANPEWVSVPLVGWSHAHALSKVADVHLVTQVRNKEAIERFGWTEGREFTTIDSEKFAQVLWKISELLRGGQGRGWTLVTAMAAPAYLYFEHLVWKRFGADLAAGRFDVVHRITPLSPTTPSRIGKRLKRLGIPFVVGPLNGGVPWPREFQGARRAEREWLSYVRGLYRLLPGYRATRSDATALVAGSSDTLEQLPAWCKHKAVFQPENGIDETRFASLGETIERELPSVSEPLRVAFVGRLVPYKGVDMLLEAMAPLIARGAATLDVIGDGPERASLEQQARTLGLDPASIFDGWVEHTALGARLGRAEVLGFPSIREFGGGVVLEAMALGLVPVVVAYGGPRDLVTSETGVLLPLGPRADIVRALGRALDELAADRARVRVLGERAKTRVSELHTWRRRAEQSLRIYEWALGRGEKPEFFASPATFTRAAPGYEKTEREPLTEEIESALRST